MDRLTEEQKRIAEVIGCNYNTTLEDSERDHQPSHFQLIQLMPEDRSHLYVVEYLHTGGIVVMPASCITTFETMDDIDFQRERINQVEAILLDIENEKYNK